MDGIQCGESVLVHNDLTKGLYFVFPSNKGKKEGDLRLGRLEKPRDDSNVDFSEPTSQTIGGDGSFHLHGFIP